MLSLSLPEPPQSGLLKVASVLGLSLRAEPSHHVILGMTSARNQVRIQLVQDKVTSIPSSSQHNLLVQCVEADCSEKSGSVRINDATRSQYPVKVITTRWTITQPWHAHPDVN